MKEKLEKRFKEINDEYTKQAKEVLNIEECKKMLDPLLEEPNSFSTYKSGSKG